MRCVCVQAVVCGQEACSDCIVVQSLRNTKAALKTATEVRDTMKDQRDTARREASSLRRDLEPLQEVCVFHCSLRSACGCSDHIAV